MDERILTVDIDDVSYPERLRDLSDPPPTISVIGDLSILERPVVAIVGTRRSTRYGERVTRELAGTLARAGACVISGMARGIDGTAHRAALEEGVPTGAVLGTGVDLCYPAAHRPLRHRIAEDGFLMSELPPGAHGHGGSFPMRNRMIAALARLTIVVEAPHGSGALRTADRALELDRDLGAVPGPIDAVESQGCNLLIQNGAHIITSPVDALTLLGLTPPIRRPTGAETPDETAVWHALMGGAADLDTLCHRAALPVQRCLAAVSSLEIRGAIECSLTGEITRR